MKTEMKPISLFFDDNQKLKEFNEIILHIFVHFDEAFNQYEAIDIKSDFQTCLTVHRKQESLIIRFSARFHDIGKGSIAEYSYQLHKDGRMECYEPETFHCIGPSVGLYRYIKDCFEDYQTELESVFKYLNKKIKKYSKKIEEV